MIQPTAVMLALATTLTLYGDRTEHDSQKAAEDDGGRGSVLVQLRVIRTFDRHLVFDAFGGLLAERERRGSLTGRGGGSLRRR